MGSSDRRAFTEARALRHDLGLTPDAPADPFAIAAAQGIEVVWLPIGEKEPVEGGFLRREGHGFILMNSSKGGRRQRFTCAHEIGHAILHLEGDVQFVDTAEQLDTSRPGNPDEREANLFAAELLMPAVGVRAMAKGLESADAVGAVSRTYLVSPMSAAIRLSECDVVDPRTVETLRSAIEGDWRTFWREQQIPPDTKGSNELVLPEAYRRRADHLLEAGVISPERHAELLARTMRGSR